MSRHISRWPAYLRVPPFVPVPLRRRRDGWTSARQGAFIGWLAQTGCVRTAAAKVGISRESAYRLRRRTGAEGFARAWDMAIRAQCCAEGASKRKFTPFDLRRAAIIGLVRVSMRRGRFTSSRLKPDNSALLRFLSALDRSAPDLDFRMTWRAVRRAHFSSVLRHTSWRKRECDLRIGTLALHWRSSPMVETMNEALHPNREQDPQSDAEAAVDAVAEKVIGDAHITPDQSDVSGRHPFLLGVVALASTCLLVFALMGATVARGSQASFDRAIMLAMRDPGPGGAMVPEGPEWLKQVMIDITALGGGTVLTLVIVAAAGFLLVQRHVLTAALLVVGTTTGGLAVAGAKLLFGRARPDVIDHLVHVGSASFPSGHSANSAMAYLTLAILLVQIVKDQAERIYLLVIAAGLTIAIGISRVYLGVHWPSDVLAGWSFGTLWALLWWGIGAALRHRYARRRKEK